ncbi:elongation factor G [Kineosporia babensis]|uniref:TetM/TetW/TetO/TetS family tetracycline resistance ribosomal protection protein n=1 Tax=Kineosporia babensis TaxID=499548 RepID=A0A9X1SUC4_9ACTN|nr:TetM/TetW/TetO/TetS family tetracycline resistance ribosomal protection protein [Kineosporia babensis]MCD5312807.1 TetM/TetW/TetO/TetS family tetracycline resistance ribosomal protection protein [Kineosporia babensis]
MPSPTHSLTLGIVAHVDAGKTSLTERLLFTTGAATTLGSVDAGTTRTDSMDLERRRGITIRASVAAFTLGTTTVTIVDTPGHPDFIAEVERSIGVLDAAVLVVSAVEGVQSQTVQIWRALSRARIPTLVFVNKTDRAGADTTRVLRQLRDHLTDALVLPSKSQMQPLIARAEALPVLFGSALTGAGVKTLLKALAQLPPAAQDDQGDASATVFAIDRDEQGHRRTWLRLWRGCVAYRSRLALDNRKPQVVTSVWLSSGDGLRPAQQIRAGQVGAVIGLADSRIGDQVGAGSPRPPQHFPPATVRALVQPVQASQRTRAFQALQEMAEEDPLINLELSDADQEAAVSLYGEVQQEVIAAVLAERFGVQVRFAEQSVLYIERVLGTGEASEEIRVNDNPYLAGIGLRVEPGTGFAFSPGIERGRLPTAFIAATEEGVRKALLAGRFGWEVQNCRVIMTSSAYCPRQSKVHQKFNKAISTVANDFRHLAPSVLHTALARAGTQVCHPVDRFELEVPESALPPILTILGRLGAQVDGSTQAGRAVVLQGSVQSARVQKLSRALPDLTSGHGILTARFDRYDPDHTPQPPVRTRRGPDPADRLTWFRAHPR